MPCWKIERRRVLQINKSAHWTITIAVKNIVWQVNSTILRCEYDTLGHMNRPSYCCSCHP